MKVVCIAVPRVDLEVLVQTKREVGLAQVQDVSEQHEHRRNNVHTLEMNHLPKAMISPFSSAVSIARSRLYPPALIKGRGAQISLTKSLDLVQEINYL